MYLTLRTSRKNRSISLEDWELIFRLIFLRASLFPTQMVCVCWTVPAKMSQNMSLYICLNRAQNLRKVIGISRVRKSILLDISSWSMEFSCICGNYSSIFKQERNAHVIVLPTAGLDLLIQYYLFIMHTRCFALPAVRTVRTRTQRRRSRCVSNAMIVFGHSNRGCKTRIMAALS